jgi:hypothetical protein
LGHKRNEGPSEVAPNIDKLLGLETEAFNLDGKPLRIEVDDIYFITGLSHRGEMVNIKARGAGGGRTMEEYITTYCIADTEKVGSQLPIRVIENLSLKIIILVLTWISGSTSLHQASRPLMFYVVECLRPMVYDWCTSLLANMKSQLTDCKLGRMRNFGFASILCSFFFERVPILSLEWKFFHMIYVIQPCHGGPR